MNFPDKFKDFKWFSERFFSIRNRKARIVPFKMNDLQLALDANICGADDILKARKGGVSTYVVLKGLHQCLITPNYSVVILAHDHQSAIDIFDIVKVAYEYLPDMVKPGLTVDNRQEMKLRGMRSRLRSHTAANPEGGRGGTIDMLHCSEIAFWDSPAQTLAAVEASLGSNPQVFRESTANGAGTWWHREWKNGKKGMSGYRPHFFPWWVESAYAVQEPDSVRDPDEFQEGRATWKGDPNESFAFSAREAQLQLTPSQARWRRRMVQKHKERFEQEYAEDDITCFLTSGNMVFDSQLVRQLFELLTRPGFNPVLQRIDELGLDVFHQFHRKHFANCEFIIGADTAEGLADENDASKPGDFSSAYVTERRTGIQVASVYGSWQPYEFAHVLADVGSKFHTGMHGYPLLGVERNEYGHAVLNELNHHLHYPNLFYAQTFDQRTQTPVKKIGWHTNKGTRPIMITDLVQAVSKGYLKVKDPEFLAECMTFVRSKKGRAEAQPGCHDDRVMAQAIAWQVRQSTAGTVPLMGTNLTV